MPTHNAILAHYLVHLMGSTHCAYGLYPPFAERWKTLRKFLTCQGLVGTRDKSLRYAASQARCVMDHYPIHRRFSGLACLKKLKSVRRVSGSSVWR